MKNRYCSKVKTINKLIIEWYSIYISPKHKVSLSDSELWFISWCMNDVIVVDDTVAVSAFVSVLIFVWLCHQHVGIGHRLPDIAHSKANPVSSIFNMKIVLYFYLTFLYVPLLVQSTIGKRYLRSLLISPHRNMRMIVDFSHHTRQSTLIFLHVPSNNRLSRFPYSSIVVVCEDESISVLTSSFQHQK